MQTTALIITKVAIGQHSVNQAVQTNETHKNAAPQHVHPIHSSFFLTCFDSRSMLDAYMPLSSGSNTGSAL